MTISPNALLSWHQQLLIANNRQLVPHALRQQFSDSCVARLQALNVPVTDADVERVIERVANLLAPEPELT
jgi:hypothetical protein